MPKIKVKGQTVQTGERPQTNGRTHTHAHTHGRYQTYYLPCYAVDNKLIGRNHRFFSLHLMSVAGGIIARAWDLESRGRRFNFQSGLNLAEAGDCITTVG